MLSVYKIRSSCLIWFVFVSWSLQGQVPYVKSVSVNNARSQQTIAIQGVNFGTNPSNIKVVFGAATATPQSISDQYIEAVVPFGATFDNIGVVNTSNGSVGNYKNSFMVSFGGTNPFNSASVSTQSDFSAQTGLYDLTIADFDGDGKSDVVTAIDNTLTSTVPAPIDFFLNTSSPGAISFSKTSLSPGIVTLHVFSADLNGDAKPEIILSEKNGTRIFIYKNNSTIDTPSFAQQIITITGAKVAQVRVKDIDLNGKADLIVTDQSNGRLFIVPNNSSLATIQFGSAISLTLPGSVGVDGIEVGDLDGDGRADLVASEFLTPGGNISIVQNLSGPGSFVFGAPQLITSGTTISNLRIGDLDGDGKPELAATALLGSSVLVFGNQSTSSIQLGAPALFDADARPWGIDFGDADGDGKTDIIVASVTQKSITILNNQSTSGNFSFLKNTLNTTYINRFPKMADMDNDGRPDFVFTSIDDNNLGVPASKISIVRNLNCVVPVISPAGPITVCSGLTQRLTPSSNAGASYQWYKDGVAQGAPSATPYIDVTATGSYTVSLINGSCSQSSSAVQVNVITASSVPTATPVPVTPVCVHGMLNLSVNNVGATSYVWTGPNSFSASGVSVSRPNFLPVDAGKYSVAVMVGTCIAQRADVIVDVVDVPDIQIISPGADLICQGQTKSLSLFPAVTGFTYQWADQSAGNISGANGAIFAAGNSGNYLIRLTSTVNPSCPPIQSGVKVVKVVQLPVVDFSLPAGSCTGQPVNFQDASSLNPDTVGLKVRYSWDFGDGNTGKGKSASHTYTSVQTFNVQLTVSYVNQTCPVSVTKFLPIQSSPTVTISSPLGPLTFCASDSLLLQVPNGFDTYSWSNGKNTSSIYAKAAGTYSVQVTKAGCNATDSKVVSQFANPIVTVSADPPGINKGSTSNLMAAGLSTYVWSPGVSLSDSLIANPKASPHQTTNYTVSGKDSNGCPGTGAISVVVFLDDAVNTLIPSLFFSPNGDTINDVWVVENAPTQTQCSVAIFDERGIKVFEAKPYLNNWNGISTRGSVLPAGVYYFVIKCDDSPGGYKAGSINIVR